MFISPTAVLKQINLLEAHLDVKLFDRSPRGLILTTAGNLIYKEAKEFISRSSHVIKLAKEYEQHQISEVRIGHSKMNPCNLLLRKLAGEKPSDINLALIPYGDDTNEFSNIVMHLGQRIDMLECCFLYDQSLKCGRLLLQTAPFCIAVSKSHRLAAFKQIPVSALYDETLFMPKRNHSSTCDQVRADLESRHANIHILDIDGYSYHMFNWVASSNSVLLFPQHWKGCHPLLETVSVDWSYTYSYGLIFAERPSASVQKVLSLF